MWGKDDGDYDSRTSWDETPDEKNKKRKMEKESMQKIEGPNKKNEKWEKKTIRILSK